MSLFQNTPIVFADASIPTVKWDRTLNAFVFRKLTDSQWIDTATTTPFAMDVFNATHGWEVWTDKVQHLTLASISDPFPASPPDRDKPKPVYSVPIFSREIGGQCRLLLKDRGPTGAFVAFVRSILTTLQSSQADGTLLIPIVGVTTAQADDFSVAPVFDAADWDARPTTWAPVIVNFS